MDAKRFDRLVKAGAGLSSRRSALLVLGVALAGIALNETAKPVGAHHHHHPPPPPPPDPDLCLNPIDPVACQFSSGCAGCVTAGHLCRLNPCVTTDSTFSCMHTKEGKNICVRQPSGTACPDFPRCKNSRSCGKGHVCGHSCCNDGQLRCFPRCSNTTAIRNAATIAGSGKSQLPLPHR